MENIKNQKIQFALSYGLKLGVALVVVLLAFYLSGTMFDPPVFIIHMVIYFIGLYMAMKRYRDVLSGGFISYGQSVGVGTRIATLSGVFVGFYYFLMIKVFDPSLAATMVAQFEEAYLAMGLPEQTVEAMYDSIRLAANPWVLFFSSIFNGFIYGLVVSLVISFFVKRKGDPFQEAMR